MRPGDPQLTAGLLLDRPDEPAAAELAFMDDVVSEAGRILSGAFPHPLGTRLRVRRDLGITTDEDRPNFEAPAGSLATLVGVFVEVPSAVFIRDLLF